MHIKFTLPWGGEFEYHREPRQPMSDGRFGCICALIAGAMVLALFLLFLAMILH